MVHAHPASIVIENEDAPPSCSRPASNSAPKSSRPREAVFEVRDAQPLPGSPHPDRQASEPRNQQAGDPPGRRHRLPACRPPCPAAASGEPRAGGG